LENNLIDSHKYFRVHPADDINGFILFAGSNLKISIKHRISEDTINSSNKFLDTL
jgi:hypothetical protein